MIKAFVTSMMDTFKADYRKHLKTVEQRDAQAMEFIEIPSAPEVCPICEEEEALRIWIRTQVVNRKIDELFIHCTGTRISATVTSILNYAKNVLGWEYPPYHIIFPYSGGFTVCADLEVVCNGVRGRNARSIHLSYIGGLNNQGKATDTRSPDQARLMAIAVEELQKSFPQLKEPKKTKGHRDAPAAKACPCFNAIEEYA